MIDKHLESEDTAKTQQSNVSIIFRPVIRFSLSERYFLFTSIIFASIVKLFIPQKKQNSMQKNQTNKISWHPVEDSVMTLKNS